MGLNVPNVFMFLFLLIFTEFKILESLRRVYAHGSPVPPPQTDEKGQTREHREWCQLDGTR